MSILQGPGSDWRRGNQGSPKDILGRSEKSAFSFGFHDMMCFLAVPNMRWKTRENHTRSNPEGSNTQRAPGDVKAETKEVSKNVSSSIFLHFPIGK